jgi:exopolysaccharide biosynthesis WecB/TagA/CpsF family protein
LASGVKTDGAKNGAKNGVKSRFDRVRVFGVPVTPCTYDSAVDAILDAAREHQPYGVAALATHGLMTAVHDDDFLRAVERLDLVTPDGQPVRWALNLSLDDKLDDRVYGPDLADRVCAAAARDGIPIYVYGSTELTCAALERSLARRYPNIKLAGIQPDRFRDASDAEDDDDVARIVKSGAGIVLVGRGCPRQELWVANHLDRVPCSMLAVGAAFDYLAGVLTRPPDWMQRAGLEWLHRLVQEPRRLWRRYLVTNSQFLLRFLPLWLATKLHTREAA